ncbi:LruC domain-containing protein [Alteromonas sp. ASW11-36]|uniref:LruC domain-containing protein n=1 Tax=Alteromonas arenosi TaxID=3055817 RepID=A0ABT7ST22_9ALTE|nr:LruC domain-containing protein [Alteromonas sp. ASW11-36]MDM7859320.1 LruC domain-containing protein [Alteromonas sp. ASW11-36]
MKQFKLPDWLMSLLVLSAAISGLQNANAVELVDGNYQWQFLSGQPWPLGYDQSTGKPEGMSWAKNDYPQDFFERIRNALPESAINEAFLTDDDGANIHLVEDGEVFVTFIHEGAGYRNSFGFFTYDRQNPPTDIHQIQETIVFPNLSFPHMTNGHRVSLGHFKAGTSIGFFIAANGYWYYTGVKPWKIPYYYSISELNPEHTAELRQHNVLLLDNEVEEVILGFEDLPRTWGDNDFNDAVFSVKVTPFTALETEELSVMPDANDSDADGIADEEDEFPNDYKRAYSSSYPSTDGYVTLAFEDNYPNYGDYDMNDLVVRERMVTIYNAQGEIAGFKLTGYIDGRGASRASGFALRLLDLPPELVESAYIDIAENRYDKQTEDYQTDAVIKLWGNSKVFTHTGEIGTCSHFNTVMNCDRFEPVPFELDVSFAYPIASLPHSSLDFFIFRTNNRSHEIHFAGYPPTDLFDPWLIGKGKDNSDPQYGRYFISESGLPWGLKLEQQWQYPREYIDVEWAYPRYELWVESAGTEEQDWYQSTTRTAHVYDKEEN